MFALRYLQDIHSQNVRGLDLDLQIVILPNVNEQIERPHATSYVLEVAIFVIVCGMFTVELCRTRKCQSKANTGLSL